MANLEDNETFQCRIDTAEENVEMMRELAIELANSVKIVNIKEQNLIAIANNKSRDKFYAVSKNKTLEHNFYSIFQFPFLEIVRNLLIFTFLFQALSDCQTAEGLSILLTILENGINWKNFKRRQHIRSLRTRNTVDYAA